MGGTANKGTANRRGDTANKKGATNIGSLKRAQIVPTINSF